jgi:hypothetical protein
MSAEKVKRLEHAIMHLKYARFQVELALGKTDSAQETLDDIDGIIEDLDADIICLKD